MTEDIYILAITALLPLAAGMLVVQTDPYQALVMRGILGAVAALVYALFGAADVALTEALVGTMLSITLYAVAVRSSMQMRLGVLAAQVPEENVPEKHVPEKHVPEEHRDRVSKILSALRCALKPHSVRLELVRYPTHQDLKAALVTKEIHATLIAPESPQQVWNKDLPYHLQTRVPQLKRILESESSVDLVSLSYFGDELHGDQSDGDESNGNHAPTTSTPVSGGNA